MKKIALYSLAALLTLACSRENGDIVTPTAPKDLPLQMVLDADEAGEFEDSDEVEMEFTFTDRFDPTGKEPGGVLVTLDIPVVVNCQIKDAEGFENLSDYILDITAFYEFDDCTEEDVDLTYDLSSGAFSFTFPADVEAVKIAFEVSEDLFDDDVLNDDRGFVVEVLGLENASNNVVINTDTEFEFKVLDDELVFGAYQLALNEANYASLLSLFAGINEDIDATAFADLDAIEVEINHEEIGMKVILTETEMVEECGETEEENIEFEIEGEFEELTDDDTAGDIEFIVEIEQEDGSVEEVAFAGSFEVDGNTLTLTLENEDEVEFTLILEK